MSDSAFPPNERGVSFFDVETGEVSRPGTGQPIASRPVSSRPSVSREGLEQEEAGAAEGSPGGAQAPVKTQDVLVEHQKTEHGETMRLLTPGSGSRGSRRRHKHTGDGDAPAEEEMPPEAGFRGAR